MGIFVWFLLGSFGVCVVFSVSHWLWFEFITIHKPRCRWVRWLKELAYCICVFNLLLFVRCRYKCCHYSSFDDLMFKAHWKCIREFRSKKWVLFEELLTEILAGIEPMSCRLCNRVHNYPLTLWQDKMSGWTNPQIKPVLLINSLLPWDVVLNTDTTSFPRLWIWSYWNLVRSSAFARAHTEPSTHNGCRMQCYM